MEARLTITTKAAAAIFSSPRQRKILLSLIERERSLSDISRATQTPLNLLHHHVSRLVGLGLASIARLEPRAGRPMKYYRAAAASFFVPAELMKAAPGEALNRRLRNLLQASLARSIKGCAYSAEGGRPKMRIVRGEGDEQLAAEFWLELRLGRAQALALTEDLHAVLKRHAALSSAPSAAYIVHVAVARS